MRILEKDGEKRIAANVLPQEGDRATEKAAPPRRLQGAQPISVSVR